MSLAFSGCQPKPSHSSAAHRRLEDKPGERELGWPKDIEGLIDHLNDWYKDELDVYERPEAYPNRITDGQTGGWVIAHKEALGRLGAKVRWDSEAMSYVLVK
jgi:hypothetical protein